jgi:hypothetical protein
MFLAGLWPFNFTEKNNASITPGEGLKVSRHGTAYTDSSPEKLHRLEHFAIDIDLASSSDGLSSFEKIFSYFINQEQMNFILGQWKDGLVPTFRTEKLVSGIKIGVGSALIAGERTRFLISYDGKALDVYQNGKVRNHRETGPSPFSNWDRTYPLIVGMDAGGRSQWRGTLYEVAIFDRAVTQEEIKSLSGPSRLSGLSRREEDKGKRDQGVGTSEGVRAADSRQPTADSRKNQAARQENPPPSPFMKGGGGSKTLTADSRQQIEDERPLIHYVFTPENTYETTFRGKKALAVRDLGKGVPADLVIPEYFEPYARVFLGWDPDWMRKSSDRLDVVVNIVGFVPFGLLLFFAARTKKCLSVLVPECLSAEEGTRGEGVGTKDGIRDSGLGTEDGLQASGIGHRDREDEGERERISKIRLASIILLVVVVGFGVSFAIEYLQAYLPSRDSSLRDLFCNTMGTLIGAIAAAWLLRSSCLNNSSSH